MRHGNYREDLGPVQLPLLLLCPHLFGPRCAGYFPLSLGSTAPGTGNFQSVDCTNPCVHRVNRLSLRLEKEGP